jgi:hypothetical protein
VVVVMVVVVMVIVIVRDGNWSSEWSR